ncbi:MAG TPA: hypothetical protein VMM12_01055 [Longimicrobiales bacterium]|nr:hypothetical protein [Longimicrobiales bacterium]
MSPYAAPRRPRPASVRSGAFFFLAAALAPSTGVLAAQELPPPAADTVPPADTIPPTPPPTLPPLDPVGPVGWEAGVWEWDRSDLLMLPDISLLDILERIPGITPVRAGIIAQPEGAAVLGTAGAAIRYIVDGFELDPLTTPTFDPSRVPLLALARLRVERRVTGAVVRMETLSPTDPRAHSAVEAATGDVGVNLFRGIFLAPGVLGGPLALGFERLAAEAAGGADHTTAWLKWTFVRDSAGVQLEYRQTETDRTGVGPPFFGERRDWALRARGRILGLAAEGYAGATTVEDRSGDLVLREGTPQAGIRLHRAFAGPVPAGARAALRFRDHPRLPAMEAAMELWVAPLPWLGGGVDMVRGFWAEGDPTGHTTLRGRLGPLLGLSAFAELPLGEMAAGRLLAPEDSLVFAPVRESQRIGASFDRWGVHLGVAAVRVRTDTVAGFGVAFDPDAPRSAGGEATGFEAMAVLPTGWAPLRVEGWVVGMERPDTWLYLPDRSWRAGLVYHHLPLPSGNLEILARVEHVSRGRMTTPCTPILECVDVDGDRRIQVGAYGATNLELTIRVVTVRAFLRWENIFHRRFQQDLPIRYDPGLANPFGRLTLPGQHILYGVKWEFWN